MIYSKIQDKLQANHLWTNMSLMHICVCTCICSIYIYIIKYTSIFQRVPFESIRDGVWAPLGRFLNSSIFVEAPLSTTTDGLTEPRCSTIHSSHAAPLPMVACHLFQAYHLEGRRNHHFPITSGVIGKKIGKLTIIPSQKFTFPN